MPRSSLPLFVTVLLAWPLAARAYHLDDTLRGTTTGNASGGTFGPDGWTVGDRQDRIWFAVPGTPTSGSIEFTLSNVTNASLFPGDDDFFQMYDDADSGEPIPYRPDWVENNFKVDLRIRTDLTPTGPVKMIIGVCPDIAVSHSSSCACGLPFGDDPFGGDPTWDGSPQRIRVEWGGGSVRYLRNGVEVIRIDYSPSGYSWGPRDMHFTLGTSRALAIDTSGLPVGAVFSDLVVDTVDGSPATCPSVGPPDAGVCDPSNVVASQDTTAAVWEPGVYSVPTDLNVEADAAGTPTGVVYLRFPPVGGTAAHATLALHTQLGGSSGGGSGQVCLVTDDTWNENTMTWLTRPTVSSTCTGGAHTVGVNEEVTWDVTSLVPASGDVNLAIVSADSDGAHYYSKEAGSCAVAPRLTTTLGPPPPDAGTSPDAGTTQDAGTVPHDAGGMDAGTIAHDAGNDGGSHHVSSGGCCSTAGTSGARGAFAACIAALLAATRPRRRRSRRG